MHTTQRAMLAALVVLPALSACATSGALRRAREEQATALANERSERLASDSALRQDLGGVRGDLQALRNDLAAMRTEFNAKITAMETGIQFDMPVNFAFDSDIVRDEDHAALDRFAKIVGKYYTGSKVTIEGFADPAGSERYNLALSQRRADAVRDYLAAKGLTTTQLATIGYGKTRLVTPGASHDQPGAELNRRVVFVIETRGQKSVAMVGPVGN